MSERHLVSTAIIGASGYSGEELIRLLSRHPRAEIRVITSRQYAGQPIGEVFPRFMESPLTFSAPDPAAIAREAQAVFLALPHGLAAEYARPLLGAGLTVIDISADFRLKDPARYQKYYKTPHPAPELLPRAIYGLPERYREQLKSASLIACPGCYPTSVILAAAPLLENQLAGLDGIAAVSASGVTGAGRKVDLPYIYPECDSSFRAYAVTGHRHLPEMEQELAGAAGVPANDLKINFIPHLAPMSRGINTTLLLTPKPGVTTADVAAAYQKAYQDEPFVRCLKPGALADTKHVTMTNMCEIGFTLDDHAGKIIVTSVIDNLTKGAAGQAIQCFNLRFGLDERMGLE